jgi:hypothetical protein
VLDEASRTNDKCDVEAFEVASQSVRTEFLVGSIEKIVLKLRIGSSFASIFAGLDMVHLLVEAANELPELFVV